MLDLKKSIQRMQPYRQGDVFSATDVCNAFSCAAHRVCAVDALNALHELADEGVLNVIKRQCMAARRLAPATAAAAGVAPTTCEAALHLGSGQDAAIKDNSGIAGVLVCVYVCCKSV